MYREMMQRIYIFYSNHSIRYLNSRNTFYPVPYFKNYYPDEYFWTIVVEHFMIISHSSYLKFPFFYSIRYKLSKAVCTLRLIMTFSWPIIVFVICQIFDTCRKHEMLLSIFLGVFAFNKECE